MRATPSGGFGLLALRILRGTGLIIPLFVSSLPGIRAEEPGSEVHHPAIPPAVSRSQTAPHSESTVLGIKIKTPETAVSRSTITGPDSASLEISRSVPFLSKITDVNLFTGAYAFDEGPDDSFTGVRAGVDFALTNRIRLEASYNQDQDLNRNNGFVGLWASIPLGKPDSSQSSASPSNTLVDSVLGEAPPTRNRTNRKPADARFRGGSGFLARVFRNSESAPPPAAPAEAPSRGPLRDLMGRLRK